MNGCITWKQKLAAGALAASVLAGAPLAGAATLDGTVGATSSGTVDVQILVPNLVLVENLDDITLNYVPAVERRQHPEAGRRRFGFGTFLRLGNSRHPVRHHHQFPNKHGRDKFRCHRHCEQRQLQRGF